MKTLMISTAIAAALALPVVAQTSGTSTDTSTGTDAGTTGGTSNGSGGTKLDTSVDTGVNTQSGGTTGDTSTGATTTATTGATTGTNGTTGTSADATTSTSVNSTQHTPLVRDGYASVASTELTSNLLTGATAYDSNDREVGKVSDLILTADGKVSAAIIDVGGFLGMGKKPVSVQLDQLDILRKQDGSDLRVYLSSTKEELEAMPTYSN